MIRLELAEQRYVNREPRSIDIERIKDLGNLLLQAEKQNERLQVRLNLND